MPAGEQVVQQIEGGHGTDRAGVICVVDDGAAVDARHDNKAQLTGRLLKAGADFLPGETADNADGGRAQGRIDRVFAQKGHLQALAVDAAVFPAMVKAEADALHAQAFDFVGPQIRFGGEAIEEGPGSGGGRHRPNAGVVPVENDRASVLRVGKSLYQLSFGLRDPVYRSQPLQMGGADIGHDADLGPRQVAQQANLPEIVHPHLQHGPLVARVQPEESQRQPLFAVEVAGVVMGAVTLREDRCSQLFCAGFAYAAGHANYPQIGAGAMQALKDADRLKSRVGVGDDVGDGAAGSQVCYRFFFLRTFLPSAAAVDQQDAGLVQLLKTPLFADDRIGATGYRLADEFMPVCAGAAEGDEQ